MSLIDISFFVGQLSIPNTDQVAVAERVTYVIQKYEQEFLRKLLGYPLYKAFVTALQVVPPTAPDQRMLDILYGKEYTNLQGYLTQWRGLIMTDNPVFSMAGQATYKPPVYLTVGTTLGLIAGTNTFTFDGTGGKMDWRGWTPILFRNAPMVPDVDYSWDVTTGILTLLVVNDKFDAQERISANFQIRTDSVDSTDITPMQSAIANYVYYWDRRNQFTKTTDFGEVMNTADNTQNLSSNQKMARAWNEMSDWVSEFIEFMDTNSSLSPDVYPEWKWIFRWDTLRYFEPLNTIF